VALTEALTTKQVVAVVAGLLVVGGGGTAAYLAAGGVPSFDDGEASPVDTVPAAVDYVVYLDPGVRNDRTTRALVNGFIDIARDQSADYDGPDDYEAIRENVSADAEPGADVDDLHHAVLYGTYPAVGNGSAGASAVNDVGVFVDSAWNETQVVDLVANGSAYERDEYEGYRVYVQQPGGEDGADGTAAAAAPTWVGVLGDGRYVIGTERAVTGALDVHAGEADAFDGPLREQYDATRDGYLRFAVNVPEPGDVTPATRAVLTANQFGAFRNLSTVAGSYYTDGESIGMQLRLGAATEDDAEDLQAVLQGTFALTEESMRTREMEQLIDSTTIDRDGTSVVVTFQRPVAEILDAVEAGVESWNELSQFSTAFGAGDSYGDIAGSDGGRDAAETNVSADASTRPAIPPSGG
jgi:hypothetical protein